MRRACASRRHALFSAKVLRELWSAELGASKDGAQPYERSLRKKCAFLALQNHDGDTMRVLDWKKAVGGREHV